MTDNLDAWIPLVIALFCIYRANKKPSSTRLKVLAAIFFMVGGTNLWRLYAIPDSTPVKRARALAEIAGASNKGLPQQVDETVRLDRVSSTVDTLEFHYTIVKPAWINCSPQKFEEAMKPKLLAKMQQFSKLNQILPLRPTFVHIYKNKDIGFEAKISITPDLYLNTDANLH